jgi:hypothetical protein
MMQRMNPRDGLARIRDALGLYYVLKTRGVWALFSSSRLERTARSVASQANTIASPRRMVPPLTTEA